MTWEMKKIGADGQRGEVLVTSFFGGQDTGRCIQLTQTEKQWDGEEHTQFISLSRNQLMELVKRIDDWDSGKANEHNPLGE